jgi:transcriptional regulator with XRE-family HTH domain
VLEKLDLGKKIQQLRMQRGVSIRKVAAQAGITPSMLSQIENEQVNPSINTLRAIAQVLDTPLYCFFTEEPQEEFVVKPEYRKTIGSRNEPDIQYELLTPDTKGDIEFCMMVIPPRLSSVRSSQSHEGEEVAYMCSGESVELEVEGKFFNMVPGDSVRITARARHSWHNHTDTTVHVIFAITPPTF